jgi:hypothetical protein
MDLKVRKRHAASASSVDRGSGRSPEFCCRIVLLLPERFRAVCAFDATIQGSLSRGAVLQFFTVIAAGAHLNLSNCGPKVLAPQIRLVTGQLLTNRTPHQ